jgi:hypothetical protein
VAWRPALTNGSLKEEYLKKIIKVGGQVVGKAAMVWPMGGALKEGNNRYVLAYVRTKAT